MNIVITLTSELIHKIQSGEKQVEIRKKAPLYFNPAIDVVNICEKGTSHIVAYMTLSEIKPLIKDLVNIGWASRKAAVNISWLINYLENVNVFYVWSIKDITTLKTPIPISEIEGLKKPPQSFVYTHMRLQNLNIGKQYQTY